MYGDRRRRLLPRQPATLIALAVRPAPADGVEAGRCSGPPSWLDDLEAVACEITLLVGDQRRDLFNLGSVD